MQEIYRVKTSPVALSDNMIIGEKYRITVLIFRRCTEEKTEYQAAVPMI